IRRCLERRMRNRPKLENPELVRPSNRWPRDCRWFPGPLAYRLPPHQIERILTSSYYSFVSFRNYPFQASCWGCSCECIQVLITGPTGAMLYVPHSREMLQPALKSRHLETNLVLGRDRSGRLRSLE